MKANKSADKMYMWVHGDEFAVDARLTSDLTHATSFIAHRVQVADFYRATLYILYIIITY